MDDKLGQGIAWAGFWIMLGLMFHGDVSYNPDNKVQSYVEEKLDAR